MALPEKSVISEINLKGISIIEHFLDTIEDVDEDCIGTFQAKFGEISGNYEESPDFGSTVYFDNKIKSECLNKERYHNPALEVVKSGAKLHDGFEECYYKGNLDKHGLPYGQGNLTYSVTESFEGTFELSIKNRTGTRMFSGGDVAKIDGTWMNGLLEGRVRTEFTTGGVHEGFYSFGVRHGFSREFGIGGYLKEFSYWVRGVRVGWTYQGQLGGGYMVGEVDKAGELTGDKIAYIYPDFRTAIRGEYEAGVLVTGRLCRVMSSVETGAGVIIPVFGDPIEPDLVYHHDPASHDTISKWPLLRDPWEDSMVEVRQSKMEQAGEGLFAKTDLPSKTIITLFAGVKLKTSKVSNRERPVSNYRIQLNSEMDLDIPDSCIETSVYNATLGHKANHSFTPNGTFDLFEHPRFGLISAISSLMDISAGEEITVNYQIGLHRGPDWYKLLWLRHVRSEKKWGDKDVARFLERNYDMTMKRIELPLETDTLMVPIPVGARELQLEDSDEEDTKA